MGDKDICILWDKVPFLAQFPAAWQGKGIAGLAVKYWLPGGPIDFDSFDDHTLVLKVDGVWEQGPAEVWGVRQKVVVVAADDHLITVGQAFEKVIKASHILEGLAYGHIAGKDQEVGGRYLHSLVGHMGITKGGNFHGCYGGEKNQISGLDFINRCDFLGLGLVAVFLAGNHSKLKNII